MGMEKFSKLETVLKNERDSKSDAYTCQIDWLVSNYDTGCLFCITIEGKEDGTWCLSEFVNFRGLSQSELRKMVDMGYMTMLEAMKKIPKYEYCIAKHEFASKDIIDSDYWSNLIPNLTGKHSYKKGEIYIDKRIFEEEIKKIVKSIDYKGNK